MNKMNNKVEVKIICNGEEKSFSCSCPTEADGSVKIVVLHGNDKSILTFIPIPGAESGVKKTTTAEKAAEKAAKKAAAEKAAKKAAAEKAAAEEAVARATKQKEDAERKLALLYGTDGESVSHEGDVDEKSDSPKGTYAKAVVPMEVDGSASVPAQKVKSNRTTLVVKKEKKLEDIYSNQKIPYSEILNEIKKSFSEDFYANFKVTEIFAVVCFSYIVGKLANVDLNDLKEHVLMFRFENEKIANGICKKCFEKTSIQFIEYDRGYLKVFIDKILMDNSVQSVMESMSVDFIKDFKDQSEKKEDFLSDKPLIYRFMNPRAIYNWQKNKVEIKDSRIFVRMFIETCVVNSANYAGFSDIEKDMSNVCSYIATMCLHICDDIVDNCSIDEIDVIKDHSNGWGNLTYIGAEIWKAPETDVNSFPACFGNKKSFE